DVDDHALTWTTLKAGQGHMQALDGKTFPRLNLRVWKETLLEAIAERCIHYGRWDPRDSGAAEQVLYDQLDGVFEATLQDQVVEVVVRAPTRCQNLFLQPSQVRASCTPLVEEVTEDVGTAFAAAFPEAMAAVLLTHAASRLPGLVPALQEAAGERVPVVSLPVEAAARTAHDLAGPFR